MSRMLEIFARWNNKNIEWILVDDGSHDATVSKLLEYKNNNPELHIVIAKNNVNSGPGISRNNGIEIASGEYLTFLDSDDFFEENFLKTIEPYLEAKYDCVIFDAFLYYNEKSSRYWSMFQRNQQEGIINATDAVINIRPGTWGKIYKKDIITQSNIKFLNQRIAEDVPFTISAILNSNIIYYVKKPLYNYVQQPNSLIHNMENVDLINARNAFLYIKGKIEKNYPIETEYLFVKMYLRAIVLSCASNISKQDFWHVVHKAEDKYPNYYQNKYLSEMLFHDKVLIYFIKHRLYYLIRIILILKQYRDKRIYKCT